MVNLYLRFFVLPFFIVSLFLFACNSGNSSFQSQLIHSVEETGGWANVGQDNAVNAYRGIYWIGKSSQIDRVEILLRATGDISNASYRMSTFPLDVQNHLALQNSTGHSKTLSGTDVDTQIQSNNGWVEFQFAQPTALVSGSTALLIYRTDGADDNSNFIAVNNPYDTNDVINDQANLHYTSNGIMAGRGSGDEDQPEPFAVAIRIYGEIYSSDTSREYPAQPIRMEYSQGSNPGIVDLSWEYRSEAILPHSYRIYQYRESDGVKIFIGTSSQASYRVTGLNSGAPYFFVVTALSSWGNESYHSLTPEDSSFNPEPVIAP